MVVAVVPVKAGQEVPPGLVQRLERVKERLAERFGPPTPDGPSVTVETVVADTASMREEARRLGLSTGRYAVFLVAEEAGLDVEPEDFAQGVGQAILAAGGHPGAVLREAHECRQVSELAEKFKEKFGQEFKGRAGPGLGREGLPGDDGPGDGDGGAGTGDEDASDEGVGRGDGPGRGKGKRPWEEAADWPPGEGRDKTGPGVPGRGPGWLPQLPSGGGVPAETSEEGADFPFGPPGEDDPGDESDEDHEEPDSGEAPDEPEEDEEEEGA